MNRSPITRRTALAAVAATAPVLALSAAESGLSAPLDRTDRSAGQPDARRIHSAPGSSSPAIQLETLIRMRGSLDERLVISFLEGVYYGVMDARITPLYGLSAGLFRQYRKRPDGGYDYANFELVYVIDLDSGELLTEFRNPYSGKSGTPPQTRLGPSRLAITEAREVVRPGQPAATPAGNFHRFRPAQIVGDDLWIVEESAVKAPPPMNFSFNEVLTYRASRRDLEDAALLHVPTDVHFNPVIGWRPWQGMSGFDGPPSHVMGSCSGRVVTSVDALPPRYLGWTQRFHADVLADPLKLLASAWATS